MRDLRCGVFPRFLVGGAFRRGVCRARRGSERRRLAVRTVLECFGVGSGPVSRAFPAPGRAPSPDGCAPPAWAPLRTAPPGPWTEPFAPRPTPAPRKRPPAVREPLVSKTNSGCARSGRRSTPSQENSSLCFGVAMQRWQPHDARGDAFPQTPPGPFPKNGNGTAHGPHPFVPKRGEKHFRVPASPYG